MTVCKVESSHKKMKKIVKLSMIALLALSLVACGNKKNDGKGEQKLVIYTPAPEDMIQKTIPRFEEETGIKVELVMGGSGELFSRIREESANPMADVVWSGGGFETMLEYFEPYESPNLKNVPEMYRLDDGGKTTTGGLGGSVILVNTNLIPAGEIKGYKDLLNPKYKGMIAHGDVTASGSSLGHVKNMLFAMNPEDPLSQESWDYVEAFLKNVDGKVVNSSGAVLKGVASGEYAIGLTYEEGGVQSQAGGAPVEMVYMEEGVIFNIDQNAIVKGGPNPENAKKFIDFLISTEYQSVIGTETSMRPIDPNAKLSENKVPISEIKEIKNDLNWYAVNKETVIDKYIEILTGLK